MDKLKILIIEDDRSTQAIYKHGLSEQIFEKRFADTGKAGWGTYQEWRPDIIILDIGLPDINGISILKKIREEIKDTSTTIVIASLQSDLENVVECTKIGVQGFVVKPFHSQIITEKILQYYNKQKSVNLNIDPRTVAEMAKYNWSNLDNIETNVKKIQINVGCEIKIQVKGVEADLTSFVTGIHHGQYILIQGPRVTGIETKLYEGNSVRVIYLYSGTVWIFKANILNFITKPLRLIFLSYPESVAAQELRKNHRVTCSLRASLRSTDQNTKCSGLVLDLSVGGCTFVTAATPGMLHQLDKGEMIEMTLELPGMSDAVSLSGEIRNIAQDSSRISMGIKFAESNSKAMQAVANYVRSVLDLL